LGGKLICVRGIAPVTVLRLRSSSLPLFASGGYPIEGGEDHFRLGVPVKHNGQYRVGAVTMMWDEILGEVRKELRLLEYRFR